MPKFVFFRTKSTRKPENAEQDESSIRTKTIVSEMQCLAGTPIIKTTTLGKKKNKRVLTPSPPDTGIPAQEFEWEKAWAWSGVYSIGNLVKRAIYNKLKPEDPDKVVDIDSTDEHIGYEFSSGQIAEFRKVFNAFDRDGNDSIGVDELGAVLRALGYSPSDSDIDKVLSRFDSDSSGDLSFEEYLALMAVWVEEDETQILEAFKVFDKSGDGYVTIEELKRALCRFGEKFSEEEADEFFDMIDANNDGIINYEEFVKYMLSEINRGPPPREVTT